MASGLSIASEFHSELGCLISLMRVTSWYL